MSSPSRIKGTFVLLAAALVVGCAPAAPSVAEARARGLLRPVRPPGGVAVNPKSDDPVTAEDYLNRAMIRPEGDPGFLTDLNEAYARKPELRDAVKHQSEALNRQAAGDLDGAVAAYDRALEISPQFGRAHFNRAVALCSQKKYDAAMAGYEAALRIYPRHVKAIANRANILDDRGDHARAIAEYGRAIALEPGNASLYYNRGEARRRAGDLRAALEDLDTCIQRDPACRSARVTRARTKSEMGDSSAAIEELDALIRTNPRDADALRNRGRARGTEAFLHFGTPRGDADLASATADFDRAVELDPAEAVLDRGLLRFIANDLVGALRDCSRAVELNPHEAGAWAVRGFLRAQNPEAKKEALADCNRALELAPKEYSLYCIRATVQTDSAAAMADCNTACSMAPRDPHVYWMRGIVHLSQGREAEARKDFDECIRLAPMKKALVEKGIQLYRTERRILLI